MLLPLELIELIALEMPQRDVARLLLVSSSFYRIAVRLVFRQLTLMTHETPHRADYRLQLLFNIVSAKPCLVSHVRKLDIMLVSSHQWIESSYSGNGEVGHQEFIAVLDHLSNAHLRELTLRGRFPYASRSSPLASPLGLPDEALRGLLRLRRTPTLKKLNLYSLDCIPYSLLAGDPTSDQLLSLLINECSVHVDKMLPPSTVGLDNTSASPPSPPESSSTQSMTNDPNSRPLSKLEELVVRDTVSLFSPLRTDFFQSDSEPEAPCPFFELPSLRSLYIGLGEGQRVLDYSLIGTILRSTPHLEKLILSRKLNASNVADTNSTPVLLSHPCFNWTNLTHVRELVLCERWAIPRGDSLGYVVASLQTAPPLPHVQTISLRIDWHARGPDCGFATSSLKSKLQQRPRTWGAFIQTITTSTFPSLQVFRLEIRLLRSDRDYLFPRKESAYRLECETSLKCVVTDLRQRLGTKISVHYHVGVDYVVDGDLYM